MGLFGGGNSTSSTQNLSETQTQDRRTITGQGSGAVNADNSTVVQNIQTTDLGSIAAALGIAGNAAQTAIQSGAVMGANGLGVADHLVTTGAGMLKLNTDLAGQLASGNNSTALSMFSDVIGLAKGVMTQSAAVDQTAAQLALAPMTQQNPDRYLIIGALAVVAVVAFMGMKR